MVISGDAVRFGQCLAPCRIVTVLLYVVKLLQYVEDTASDIVAHGGINLTIFLRYLVVRLSVGDILVLIHRLLPSFFLTMDLGHGGSIDTDLAQSLSDRSAVVHLVAVSGKNIQQLRERGLLVPTLGVDRFDMEGLAIANRQR